MVPGYGSRVTGPGIWVACHKFREVGRGSQVGGLQMRGGQTEFLQAPFSTDTNYFKAQCATRHEEDR